MHWKGKGTRQQAILTIKLAERITSFKFYLGFSFLFLRSSKSTRQNRIEYDHCIIITLILDDKPTSLTIVAIVG